MLLNDFSDETEHRTVLVSYRPLSLSVFILFFCISSGYRSLCSQESYLNMNMFNYLFFDILSTHFIHVFNLFSVSLSLLSVSPF